MRRPRALSLCFVLVATPPLAAAAGLVHTDFEDGTEGWTATGPGTMTTVPGLASPWNEHLHLSSDDPGFVVFSPALPPATDRIAFSAFVEDVAGRPIVLARLEDAAGDVLLELWTGSGALWSGEPPAATRLGPLTRDWHRFAIAIGPAGFDVTFGATTASVPRTDGDPVHRMAVVPWGEDVSLDDFHATAGIAVVDDAFDGAPASSRRVNVSSNGVGLTPQVFVAGGVSGFRDRGLLRVVGSPELGEWALGSVDVAGFGPTLTAEVAFLYESRAFTTDHQALFAVVGSNGRIPWAVTLGPRTAGLDGPSTADVDGMGLGLVRGDAPPSPIGDAFPQGPFLWRQFRAVFHRPTGDLWIELDGEPWASVTLGATEAPARIAVGDVWTAPGVRGVRPPLVAASGDGSASFDGLRIFAAGAPPPGP